MNFPFSFFSSFFVKLILFLFSFSVFGWKEKKVRVDLAGCFG